MKKKSLLLILFIILFMLTVTFNSSSAQDVDLSNMDNAQLAYNKLIARIAGLNPAPDTLDEAAFARVLERLRTFAASDKPVDLLVTNYIYDKTEATGRKREIRYKRAFR